MPVHWPWLRRSSTCQGAYELTQSLRHPILIAALLLVAACAGTTARNAVGLLNEQAIESGSPYRWESEQVDGGSIFRKVLTGEPGQTLADETLRRDIIAEIAASGANGPGPADRPKEIRVVSQSILGAEEIWVFEGPDGDLVYVVILQTSNDGGTDLNISGPW